MISFSTLLPSRAVLRISGPDSRAFLQGLVTNNVEKLEDGEAAFAALLTPQGKILFDFLLVARGDGFLIDCNATASEALQKRLTLYRLRAKTAIEKLEDFAVGCIVGNSTRAAGGDVIAFADPRLLALGRRLIGPKAGVIDAVGESAAESRYDAHRRALGVPEFGRDFAGDEVFLLDVNYDALGGVDYKKGCFVGQEVTSRMKRKGEIRKRTLTFAYEGEPPPKGAPVTAGEGNVGEVLSAFEGSGLALIRLDRLAAAREAGMPPTVEGSAVKIGVPAWLERG
ncbi:MAG: folate-binding protein [Pseudomonadota bacterium]|nr:folate-binding protein [Pseudomonadota bacterium]